MALWVELAQGQVEIKRSSVLGDLVWIDLTLKEKNEFRFYPDVITLSLLARWSPCPLPPCRTVSQLLRQLGKSLNLPHPLEADVLSEAGFAVLEDGSGAPNRRKFIVSTA